MAAPTPVPSSWRLGDLVQCGRSEAGSVLRRPSERLLLPIDTNAERRTAMKAIKPVVAATAVGAGLLLSSDAPVFAQGAVGQGEVLEETAADGNDSSNRTAAFGDDDDDDEGNEGLWGLLGLLGLIGLAGLKRRDRHPDVHVTRTHTTDVPRT